MSLCGVSDEFGVKINSRIYDAWCLTLGAYGRKTGAQPFVYKYICISSVCEQKCLCSCCPEPLYNIFFSVLIKNSNVRSTFGELNLYQFGEFVCVCRRSGAYRTYILLLRPCLTSALACVCKNTPAERRTPTRLPRGMH